MENIDILSVVMRWLHIVAAILAVGGAAFIRFVLMPSARTLPEETRQTLRAEVLPRFGKLFVVSLSILVVTGFANFFMYQMPLHKDGGGAYHGIIGTKILLAFVVFFIGSALTGKAPVFASMRKKTSTWLLLNTFLALAIVALAAVAREMSNAVPRNQNGVSEPQTTLQSEPQTTLRSEPRP